MKQSSTLTAPYGRISFFFFLVLVVLTWGFYKTYIIFFPSFDGFKPVQHFHGAMMLIWMAILIAQPLLIRTGKQSIHRLIGRITFVIAPLVVISIFLISAFGYFEQRQPIPHNARIGTVIGLNMPVMLAFIIFYSLGIFNRHNTYEHMRYMIGTAVLMIGPGLGRALIIYFHVPFPVAVTYTHYLAMGIAGVLLLNDLFNKRSYRANAIVLGVIILVFLAWKFQFSQPLQGIGEFIVKNFF